MFFKKSSSEYLEPELFRNPTAEYRGIPFWSWNCRVTEGLIADELKIFREMGFGGVDIHSRTGLDTEYLGEEYMKLIRYAAEKCEEMGIACWLYDDDRFPSGSAGGQVSRNQRLRGRFLLVTAKSRGEEEGFLPDQISFEAAIDAGEKPEGYFAAAYVLEFSNGCLLSYHRLASEEQGRRKQQAGQMVRFAYVKMMPEEAWFEDQAYADTMNPDAVDAFLHMTHEIYTRWIGEKFGSSVPAIFTDEPRLGKHKQISCADSGEDVTMPYTEYFAQMMRKQVGTDPLDIVPEYIWNRADGNCRMRYLYRECAAECFVQVFLDRIAEWCAEHRIAMTGHVLGEDTLGSQVFALGDCMRCYRNMDLPGIDILLDRREYAAVKQAVSVARQNGRDGVVSELYGVTHWDCDFKTFKLQGDWQAALGVTIRVLHLSHMSLKGEAKRDWPGSVFFQAPWYREFPCIEDHFARVNTALTRGRAIAEIGVIHPVESMWVCMGPEDQTGAARREMDMYFQNLVRWLLLGTLDFDFLSESLLPDQCKAFCRKPSGKLRVGEMEYSVVLVPDLLTIRSTTLDVLEAFSASGGTILFLGRIPKLVDAEQSDRAIRLAKQCICIGKDQTELYEALKSFREVAIYTRSGAGADNLLYQLREENDCRWLFVGHAEQRRQHSSYLEQYQIQVKGCFHAQLFDTQNGEIREADTWTDGKSTWISCSLYAEDSALYQLKERKDGGGSYWKKEIERVPKYQFVQSFMQADTWRREEKNVLLLDYAQYQVDGGTIEPREEILRLDNRVRRQLGFVVREDRMNQPYHLQEKEHHTVRLFYNFDSDIRTEAFLALEESEHCRVWLNGTEAQKQILGYYVDPSIEIIALPEVREGENKLVLEVDYHQKTNLENLFVLGDFDVELSGSHAAIRRQRDSLFIGDITRQGMPFYTGSLEYTFYFSTADDGAEYEVRIPNWKAPLLSVWVDGEKKGPIAFSPHRKKIGRLRNGMHQLTVCVYGNRFNGFGTLHNANDNYVWYGPDSYRTEGDDWTDVYRVRETGIMSAVEIWKL